MTPGEERARNRYFAIAGVRIAGVMGALLGLVLLARGYTTGHKVLGTAIVLAAMFMMAVVPRALARRWRSDPP